MNKLISVAAVAALVFSASAQAERSGEAVYQSKCTVCHATGVAGAPKLGDTAAWAPRFEKGTDALLATAKTGIRAMPPKGTCMDCSDDELRAAIDYMLEKSK